tara:strand:+ start:631 stop:792 length:162 start_codon:yes stop_codon:yes gene_type:complete
MLIPQQDTSELERLSTAGLDVFEENRLLKSGLQLANNLYFGKHKTLMNRLDDF